MIDHRVRHSCTSRFSCINRRGYSTIVIMELSANKFFDILGNKVVKHARSV
jgi:hypothetical protein